MASAHQASLAFPAREHGSPALTEGSVMELRRVLIIVLPSACMSDPSTRCFRNNMVLANLRDQQDYPCFIHNQMDALAA